MTVQNASAGEIFNVRIFKELTTAQGRYWVNNYEIRANAAASYADLLDAAQALVGFERSIHFDAVRFDRFTVSTWLQESGGYNPSSFVTVSLGDVLGEGAAGGPQNITPLTTCMLVRRAVPFGRQGRALYRGGLQNADIVSGADGRPQVSSSGPGIRLNNGLADLAAAGMLGGADGSPSSGAFSLVMVGDTAAEFRYVTGLAFAGVVVKKTDNRYFDRAASTIVGP